MSIGSSWHEEAQLKYLKKGNVAMKANQDTYKEVRTYTYPNAIVRVYIPDLTEEERERRMKILMDETAKFMRAIYAEERERKERNKRDCD